MGGNSFGSNLAAALSGALMYFATLTYAGLVVALSTLAGWLYGLVVG